MPPGSTTGATTTTPAPGGAVSGRPALTGRSLGAGDDVPGDDVPGDDVPGDDVPSDDVTSATDAPSPPAGSPCTVDAGRTGTSWEALQAGTAEALMASAVAPAAVAAPAALADPAAPAVTCDPMSCRSRRYGRCVSRASGPVAHSSRGSDTDRKARTTSGSKWVPAQRTSSSRAARVVRGSWYGRAAVIDSYASTTPITRPASEISSPASPIG